MDDNQQGEEVGQWLTPLVGPLRCLRLNSCNFQCGGFGRLADVRACPGCPQVLKELPFSANRTVSKAHISTAQPVRILSVGWHRKAWFDECPIARGSIELPAPAPHRIVAARPSHHLTARLVVRSLDLTSRSHSEWLGNGSVTKSWCIDGRLSSSRSRHRRIRSLHP